MTRLRITFHTPLFSKGSYDDRPEIRPASIRGHLHWWFRALGGTAADENAIFGSVHAKPVLASKIVVRVGAITGQIARAATLPHDPKKVEASRKAAYLPGTSFELHLRERLGGLPDAPRRAFQRTLEAWLLLGTLGLRATRAAGSFTWEVLDPGNLTLENPPASLAEYQIRCESVLRDAALRLLLLPKGYASAEDARRDVSDTLGGKHDPAGTNELARLRDPLGRIHPRRKSSPLRFRIFRLATGHHIAAVWDNRSPVTGNQPTDLDEIIRLLAACQKPIGLALQAARPFPDGV